LLNTSVDFEALNSIEEMNDRIQSPELFDKKVKYLEKASNDEGKEKIAKFIYLQHGIKWSYQISNRSFVTFNPTKHDIEMYQAQEKRSQQISDIKKQLIFQLKERNI
jgi:hypothetical protein